MSLAHEWFTLTFPGQGNGGRDMIRKITTPGTFVTDTDSRFLSMLLSMRMMRVERTVSDTANIDLPLGADGHEIVLKMHASKEMRDMVGDYIQGRCMIDPVVWEFLISGEYIRVYRDVTNNRRARIRDLLHDPEEALRPPSPPRQPAESLAQRVYRVNDEFNMKRALRRQQMERANGEGPSSSTDSDRFRTPSPAALRVPKVEEIDEDTWPLWQNGPKRMRAE